MTLNSTQALTGLTHAFKCAVDASAPDSQLTRDVSDLFAILKRDEAHLEPSPEQWASDLCSCRRRA